jgi:hypothetical protein
MFEKEETLSTTTKNTTALHDPPAPVRAKLAAAWTSFMFFQSADRSTRVHAGSQRRILATALPRLGAPRRHLPGRDLFGGPARLRSTGPSVLAAPGATARRPGTTRRRTASVSNDVGGTWHRRSMAVVEPPDHLPAGHPLGPSTVVVGWLPCQCVQGAGDSMEQATARARLQAP